MLYIILEYIVLAATFTLAKQTLSYAPYLLLLTVRFVLGTGLLLVPAALCGLIDLKKIWRDKSLFLLAGLLHMYLAFVPEFWALQHLPSAKVALYYALTPFVSALLSYALWRERLSWYQLLGMGVAAGGMVPLFVADAALSFSFALPDLMVLGAVFSAASAWFVIKKLMDRGHHLVTVNGITMALGALLCGASMLVAAPQAWQQVTQPYAFMGWLVLLVLLSHGVSYNLYSWLLMRYSITFMTLCGFMCPLFSAGFGALFLHEQLSWQYWTGLAAVVLGLVLFTHKTVKKHKK